MGREGEQGGCATIAFGGFAGKYTSHWKFYRGKSLSKKPALCWSSAGFRVNFRPFFEKPLSELRAKGSKAENGSKRF
jgi:hypothetical protein